MVKGWPALNSMKIVCLSNLDERETQYGQELALTEQLLASRRDISRQAETVELQQQLSVLQQGHPLLFPDVDARTVATVIADWTGVPLSIINEGLPDRLADA